MLINTEHDGQAANSFFQVFVTTNWGIELSLPEVVARV